jgi:hypothetical protein
VGEALFQFVHAIGVAFEQVEEILLGSHWALQATKGEACHQRLDSGEGGEELFACIGETLAKRHGLGGNVVGAPGEDQFVVLGGAATESNEHRHTPVADEFQRGVGLQLFDVLGEVTRRHPLVDVLGAGQGAELLDAGLDVVAGGLLPGCDRFEVDLVDDRSVRLDSAVGNTQTEIALGFEDGDPQGPLQDHLGFRRPDSAHLRAGIAGGEDVGDGGELWHRDRIVAGRPGSAATVAIDRPLMARTGCLAYSTP